MDTFGDFSLCYQRIGVLAGGVRFECGKMDCTASARTQYAPTTLTEVYAGFAIADTTCGVIGKAKSVCGGYYDSTAVGGNWVCWSFSDLTFGSVCRAQFVVFGY